MVVVSRYLFYRHYVALCLWPFIFVKEPKLANDPILMNHERIHLRQQKEMLVLPFYLMYILEWTLKCLWYLNGYEAYRNLSFEREAYRYESDLTYLSRRRMFAFVRYLWRA